MIQDAVYMEQLIAGSFVKYIRLSELITSAYAGSNCTEINLFIDLNSVLKQAYSVNAWGHKTSNRFEITSTILNMCGHYREFFRAIGVNTNIFLIYGLNCPNTNNTFVRGYNAKFVASYIKKPDLTALIEDNMSILNIISQYIPKVYFFDIGQCEVSSMVDYIIRVTNSKQRGIENIIISKDVLMLQMIPEHDVRVIRPVKNKNGDESYITWNANLWPSFIHNYRKNKEPSIIVSNTFFQNVLAMTSVPERGMYSLFSIPKVLKFIDVAVKSGFINGDQFYNQSTLNTVLTAMDIQCNTAELEMRFKAINTHFQSQYVLPLEKPEFKRLRLIDLEDIDTLKNIINKYFPNTPIDLDRL